MGYKWWLIIAIALFVVGLVLGLRTPTSLAGPASQEVNVLEQLADFLASLPRWSLFLIIFLKNVTAVLFSFILSPFFCLVPILTLTVNGWLIGVVSAAVIEEKSITYLLVGLLPHGILELPALIMGEAVALSFGVTVMLAIFRRERRGLILASLKQNARYLAIALGLFLPAAIIETYLTPLLIS
jgi:stage II sporulation protein M